ncbi:uncharacterized protein [Miscanthus floridulus]|uniref:uncharacterized protein n=1 Tax=Miscanthus floridulus TaxID=154761 RepID=UPI00345A60F1
MAAEAGVGGACAGRQGRQATGAGRGCAERRGLHGYRGGASMAAGAGRGCAGRRGLHGRRGLRGEGSGRGRGGEAATEGVRAGLGGDGHGDVGLGGDGRAEEEDEGKKKIRRMTGGSH